VYSNEDYLLELIADHGLITPDDVNIYRTNLVGSQSVIELMIQENKITEEQVARVCAESSSVDFIDLAHTPIAPDIFNTIPEDIVRRFKAVPVSESGGYLVVALADPLNFEVLDTLPHIIGREITPVCATPSAIEQTIKHNYGASDDEEDKIEEGLSWGGEDDTDANDAPIIKLVSHILIEAFKLRASDIHIEPLEKSLRVRYRVDGKLIEIDNHPRKLLPAIVARLKVMSGSMSIAEKRLPQDGRIQIQVSGKDVDLRVSSVPSNHGESIVMRILDKTSLMLGLPELGFLSDDQDTFKKMIGLPDGIILVTGPTGSGKTTTLYACLNVINRPDKKIITVEDPVEYEMPGINQVMVRTEIGMTFGAALRAMLRQAPNIIMIGEIRDQETANIAINAALTGHLVFSTLHTNDAPSAIARLADIGVKKFLIASAIRAIIAQRLVRKLCPVCKAPTELSERELRMLNIDGAQMKDSSIFGAVGCEECRTNGYKGRMGLFEIFKIDDEVSHMINDNLSSPQLRKRARELGMRTLREDGIRKVLSGMTSAEEVIGVTMADGM
jgi:type II secretory ATPase GspE/PulE/Tfp pilus assembly ATPase PilB-like protein